MLLEIKTQLHVFLEKFVKEVIFSYQNSFSCQGVSKSQSEIPILFELECPSDKSHGQFSSNIALKSAKILKRKPLDIAKEFILIFEKSLKQSPFLKNKIVKMEVKEPGFINFFLSHEAYYEVLTQIFEQKEHYGRSELGKGKHLQIEFVSANPTGPLSVAHARQAAVGDALANILQLLSFQVKREYYVNDEGNQINILGHSIRLRAEELLGQPIKFPEDHYQGEYIRDMAQIFLKLYQIKDFNALKAINLPECSKFGVEFLLDIIRKELDDFGVHFDNWAYQSQIATEENIVVVLDYLHNKGFLYEKDGALWFKSTNLGDDKDRVVKKSDGSYTYLTPDMVYHKNKFERGFDELINIWGPDHHGYIPRIKAFVEALGKNPKELKILIVQLATIFREGQPVSMSTRRGQYISLREVMDEVGVDAARFFLLMRHIKVHLEFDLDLAKKQTPENPVYYIQYAHARVHSMNKKAQEVKIPFNKGDSFSCLKEEEELDLIHLMGRFPEILQYCYDQMDPYPLVSYLQELATVFHKFYDLHRVIDPQNIEVSKERLALANAARIVLANGLKLLGVSRPESM